MIISRPDLSSLVDEDFSPEWVIVDLRNGRYYCLNESAAFIWLAVKSGPKSLNRICRELSRHFLLETPVAQAETEAFILKMEEASLLVADRAAIPEESSAETGDTTELQAPWITPSYVAYNELESLLLIDPIHEVDDKAGWPNVKPENPLR